VRARGDAGVPAADEEYFHSRVLAAAGIDVAKDVTGKWHSSAQQWIVARWLSDLGLTDAEALVVVAELSAKRHNGPPSSLAYFDNAMAEAAGRKQAGRLAPIKPSRPPPDTMSAFGDCPERE
jgi:hypothetical protein